MLNPGAPVDNRIGSSADYTSSSHNSEAAIQPAASSTW